MKFYLGPFKYWDDELGERWAAPENARLIFDFRPLPSQSDYIYRDRPYAVFAADALDSEYELLGEGLSLIHI